MRTCIKSVFRGFANGERAKPLPASIVPSTVDSSRIRGEQIRAILRMTPTMMAANIINALISVLCLQGTSSIHVLAIWASAVIVFASMGLLAWWRSRHRKIKEHASENAIRRAVTHATILGAIWGLLPLIAFPGATTVQQVFISCLLAGMICGGAFALSTIPLAAATFTIPMIVNCGLVLILNGDPVYSVIAALLGGYALIIWNATRTHCMVFIERLKAQGEVEQQREVIGLLLKDFEESASDWLWQIDKHGRFAHVSQRMADILHTTVSALEDDTFFNVLGQIECKDCTNDTVDSLAAIAEAMDRKEPYRDRVILVKTRDGERWWSLSAKPSFDDNGQFVGYRGVGADITASKVAEDKIRYLADFDPTTGLPNRSKFRSSMDHAIERQKRTGGRFALFFIDLDHFKSVNDTYGHPVGDALLSAAAQRLKNCVGERDIVARLGGDELAVLCFGDMSRSAMAELAGEIIECLSAPFDIDQCHIVISASVGIAVAPTDGRDCDTLLKNADLALYRSKGEGRGVLRFFEPRMDIQMQRQRSLELDLKRALGDGELELHFQPLVRSDDNTVTCFEALLRWSHPQRGPIAPSEFIAVAEQIGFIREIGAFVIDRACGAAALWPEEISIAVNLSPKQFSGSGVVHTIERALRENGVDPKRLEVEITEGVFLDNSDSVIEQLTKLRELGVSVVMDDFGTGYSSLAYLWKFPFDKIKIDQSFIAALGDDDTIIDILKSVTNLGQTLRMDVTAEGVETSSQAKFLRKISCDTLQGYLFARPMPLDEVSAYLANSLAESVKHPNRSAPEMLARKSA